MGIDPAAPKMQEIVKGGPKLVKIDLRAESSRTDNPIR